MPENIKSKKRVSDHCEVFTNQREVNAVLDFVKHKAEHIDSLFLEPACGNGNFLAEVLRRKLATIDEPVKDFPLIHFLKLSDSEFAGLKDAQDE